MQTELKLHVADGARRHRGFFGSQNDAGRVTRPGARRQPIDYWTRGRWSGCRPYPYAQRRLGKRRWSHEGEGEGELDGAASQGKRRKGMSGVAADVRERQERALCAFV